jgi:hypothetical protein
VPDTHGCNTCDWPARPVTSHPPLMKTRRPRREPQAGRHYRDLRITQLTGPPLGSVALLQLLQLLHLGRSALRGSALHGSLWTLPGSALRGSFASPGSALRGRFWSSALHGSSAPHGSVCPPRVFCPPRVCLPSTGLLPFTGRSALRGSLPETRTPPLLNTRGIQGFPFVVSPPRGLDRWSFRRLVLLPFPPSSGFRVFRS